MDFLNKIVADVKASATKTATNVYTATLGKAQDAANNLFGVLAKGTGADLEKGTIPLTAVPQQPAGPTPAVPLAPASIAGAVLQPDYTRPLLIAGLALAALFLFKRD